MANHPRDMHDWIRNRERSDSQQRSIPALIQGAVDVIRDEAEKDTTRHPAAPIELEYQTAFYLDTLNRRRVRFLLDFPDVVFNTDATPAVIQQYELWGREETPSALERRTSAVPALAMPGATLPSLAATVSSEQIAAEEKPWTIQSTNVASFFRAEGYIPGSVWRFRARAIGVSTVTPGEWSEEVVVQMLDDENPPPMPTAPTLRAQRGTITVFWDGQAVSGAMPPDFKYAILAHGDESSPTFEIARFGRGGGFKVVTDLEYYDPQFFRLRAVDESGNMGPWSEQAVGFTTPLVDRDVILSTIDAAKTHLKNIDAGVSILPNTIITEHLVVTEEMTAAIANFLTVNADMINANSIWADEGFFGLADALLFRGDAFEGKTFTGGTFTGPTFQTNVEEYTGLKLNPAGLRGYNTGGVETFNYDAATGNVSIGGGVFTGGVFQTSSFPNMGIKIDSAGARAYDSTSGKLTFNVSATSGYVTTVGRYYSSVSGEPGIAIVPPSESWNGIDMGVFFAANSHSLPGHVTAAIWMEDPAGDAVKKLNMRGSNGGGINAPNGATVDQNLILTGSNPRISSATEIVLDCDFNMVLDVGANKVLELRSDGAAYAMTSSSPANVYMHVNGQIFKSTSSLRFKTDVEPWEPGYRVLDIESKSWVDKAPVDPDAPLKRYYGAIAEQVYEVMPEMATIGADGLPEGVQYERVGVALIPVVRDLLRRIEILEGR